MSISTTDFNEIQEIANKDVEVLKEKGKSYGSSWKKRGGVGAFMMLARKWDRIENQCKEAGYDIFVAGTRTTEGEGPDDGILDDIADLRRYLLLVEEEVLAQLSAPGRRYVNPDL